MSTSDPDLEVRPVPSTRAGDWDTFVRSAEGWTPSHLYGWRNIVEAVHGHRCHYLGAHEGDRLRGVLPLVQLRSRIFGHFLVSMPFVNYGGPLGGSRAVQTLTHEAVRLSEREGADLMELRSSVELPLDLPASHRKITVLLDLPSGDPDILWKALKGKVRSQVRRPMKDGIVVRHGADQLDAFYRVLAEHMRDLGTPVQARRFYEVARSELGEAMWFAAAYLEDRPVAGGCGFRWANRFELVWASSLREFSRSAPNMLLYWSFIERCIEDGAEVFDFGRCTAGGGTHRFKSQWGGRDEPLWWYQHGPRTGAGTPSPDSGPFSFGPKVWRKLPVSVANFLGPRVVKFIP